MLMKKSSDIPAAEITPKSLYMNRRAFLAGAAALTGATLVGGELLACRFTR